ncbi:MAG: glycoside hydrolase family 31 protein, partial [Bacteroidota bacterium]
HFIQSDIVRFRYAATGAFDRDFSYALANFQPILTSIEVEETAKALFISSAKIRIEIRKKSMRLRIFDKAGKLINEEKRVRFEENIFHGGYHPTMEKILQEDEAIYGLGDRPSAPNLRGKKYELWATDSYAYEKDQEILYKNIPFYMGAHSGGCYGIFLDNSFRSHFDFGKTKSNRVKVAADGGELNYYFIYGDNLLEVAENYTVLTGKPEMPPFWALGYHQCKWSYFPEARVHEIADKFRALQIPCDVIYLDIDYMDGFRVFTWDKAHFPDPKGLVQDLEGKGFKTVIMIDCGIKEDMDYHVCREGVEKDMFCRFMDGPLMRGPVWPGYCYFPDYTNPKVRDWWVELMKPMLDTGVHGIWNDMNEPAIFLIDNFEQTDRTFPDSIVHHFEGQASSHRKAHNIYGMQMARSTYNSLKAHRPEKRPFNITRATFAGGQRHALGWTGDNVASWEHLMIANWQCQSMSVSGFSFIGSDVGGFCEVPTPELYYRWVQLAVFHPFFRTHSSRDFNDQEPWSFGKKCTDIVRAAIELRYQLLDYLYTAFRAYQLKGTPMLRPLGFVDHQDAACHQESNLFGVGNHLLVAAVPEAGLKKVKCYLPEGEWFTYWNDQKVTGGKTHKIPVKKTTFPFFVKAGAVLPLRPVTQFIESVSPEAMALHVYAHQNSEGVKSKLYEDAGEGYAFLNGEFNIKEFVVLGSEETLHIHQTIEGSFEENYQIYQVLLHGLYFEPKYAVVDGQIEKIELTEVTGKACWSL